MNKLNNINELKPNQPSFILAMIAATGLSIIAWPRVFAGIVISPLSSSILRGEVLLLIWIVFLGLYASIAVLTRVHNKLPTRLMQYAWILALLYSLVNSIASHDWLMWLDFLLALVIGAGLPILAIKYSASTTLKDSDVKLSALACLFLGTPWRACLFILVTILLSLITGLIQVQRGKMTLKSQLSLLPFMLVSLLIVQLFGSDVLNLYQNLINGA